MASPTEEEGTVFIFAVKIMRREPNFLVLNPPPKFNPDRDDAGKWLVEFLTHCQEKNLYDVDRTTMAIICMDGEAAEWTCRIMCRKSINIPMEDIILDPKVIPEWKHFAQAFIVRFLSGGSKHKGPQQPLHN